MTSTNRDKSRDATGPPTKKTKAGCSKHQALAIPNFDKPQPKPQRLQKQAQPRRVSGGNSACPRQVVYAVSFTPLPGTDGLRAFRAVLKIALRRFRLRAVRVCEPDGAGP